VPVPSDVQPRIGERVRPSRKDDLGRFVEIDAAAGGASRKDVIAALLAHGEAIAFDDAGETAGFACCRRFGRGHVIGPVVARDTATAKALIAHLVGANAGSFIRIDVPAASGLSDWLGKLGLARVDTVVTMARGAPPKYSRRFHVIAAVNQALG